MFNLFPPAKRLTTVFGLFSLLVLSGCSSVGSVTAPLPVRTVVVTMFEIGEDTGDTAGEFQLWFERRNLTEMPFLGHHSVYYDAARQQLVMVTGVGNARSAASVMALGMDSRFDFRQAYWVVAGIAGIDPQDATVGSAVWAEYLVDGDLAHEIDAREIPEDWSTGYLPINGSVPFDADRQKVMGDSYRLNPALVDWAYELTRDMTLPDAASLQQLRARYEGYPGAQSQPRVIKGDHLAAMTFWHGELLNRWANDWVDYWSGGEGEFVTSGMEDTGTYLSLSWLDKADRVDLDRLLVLRTGSNFTLPPPGVTAAENLARENDGYAGLQIAVEAAYQVAARVVDEISDNWASYQDGIQDGIKYPASPARE